MDNNNYYHNPHQTPIMHPSTPAPPPVVYDNRPPPPMPSPGPAMQQQFADVKQPQPMVSPVMQGQQQYPPVPVGSPPPPFQQQPPQQQMPMQMQQPMVASPVQQQPIPAAATMPVVYSQGHGPQLSPWSSHVFDCFDSADELFMACLCPCIVFGKTRARLRDPSMATYDTVNSDCAIWTFLSMCGLSCIYQWGARKEIRERYAIKGDEAEDAMLTLCCPVCALVQEEKEVVRRTTQQQAAPTGYIAQPQMQVPVQMQMPMQVHRAG
ncbi:DUF614 domain protein [Apiospora arundinis]|uniref:DUF614 domain protein n=1 Tax=Apiospora arundinis TaxID=335852 RepID=A0ABR2HTP2_9PEZI